MNLYIAKPSVRRTIFFSPVIVQCTGKNLDITNQFPQSLGTSLNRGSTVKTNDEFSILKVFRIEKQFVLFT